MNLGTLGASLVPLGPPELTARPRVWQVSMYVIMYVDRCSLHKPGADELARPRSRSSEQAPWIASWNLLQPSPQSCIPAPMHHPARAPTAPNCDCNLRVCFMLPGGERTQARSSPASLSPSLLRCPQYQPQLDVLHRSDRASIASHPSRTALRNIHPHVPFR